MSYSHSFSSEFYFALGEPYDTNTYSVNAHGQPTSLYSAIMMRLETDDAFVDDVDELLENGADVPYDILALELMNYAEEVDTCTNLDTPVEVWLDEKGDLRVKVW